MECDSHPDPWSCRPQSPRRLPVLEGTIQGRILSPGFSSPVSRVLVSVPLPWSWCLFLETGCTYPWVGPLSELSSLLLPHLLRDLWYDFLFPQRSHPSLPSLSHSFRFPSTPFERDSSPPVVPSPARSPTPSRPDRRDPRPRRNSVTRGLPRPVPSQRRVWFETRNTRLNVHTLLASGVLIEVRW